MAKSRAGSRGGESAGERIYFVIIQGCPSEAPTDSPFPEEHFTDLPPREWMSKADALEWDGLGEAFKAGQHSARAFNIWKMNYRPDMDPEKVDVPKIRRLKYEQRVYNIIQADQTDRRTIKLVTLAKVG